LRRLFSFFSEAIWRIGFLNWALTVGLALVVLWFLVNAIFIFRTHEQTFRVGLVSWPGSDVLILARENGYFKGTVIRLVPYPSATETIRAFQNESIDVAALTGDEVVRLIETQPDTRIFHVLDFSNGADAIVARKGINSLRDLKNKRIGVEPNALGGFMLSRALEIGGLRPGDVEIVPRSLGGHVDAFIENRVDAVVAYEPALTQLFALGARQIFSSRNIPFEIFDVLVARRNTLERRRSAVRVLVDAWAKAVRDLRDRPDESFQKLADYYKVDKADIARAMKGIIVPDPGKNKELFSGNDSLVARELHRLSRAMADDGLIAKAVDPTPAVAP